MNELKIHVERIVRPIGATQGRKLRMRLDLLAHLQEAVQEERRNFPDDERAAIEQAKIRLGEPTELTRALQQTVPAVERTLMGKLAVSPRFDQWEHRMSRVPGQHGMMTLGHKCVLSVMATLAFAQLVISMLNALASVEMQTSHYILSKIGVPLGWFGLLFVSYRFVFEAASGSEQVDWPGTLKRGLAVFAAQMALMFFIFFSIADRLATIPEIITCVAATVFTLVISGLAAYRIGVLRRPYDEWLALNITE